MKNYQGSFLVQDMVLDDLDRVGVLRNNFRKKGRLVLRNPIPGIEIMLPASKLEAIRYLITQLRRLMPYG